MKKNIFLLFILVLLTAGSQAQALQPAAIDSEVWGEVDGKTVRLFTLTNENGMVLQATNYGATITNIVVPDKNGLFQSVVIGFDSLKDYREKRGNHGKTIGRFANRIGGAQFTLNGTAYHLTANNGPNSLHGGPAGFSTRVFDVDSTRVDGDTTVVSLHYTSADMEEGFPGNLTLYLDLILTGDNEVKLAYKAVTDKPTVVNFTNHSYFNLTGSEGPVLDEQLKIVADSITALGPGGIPTGELDPVAGTTYDFRQFHTIREQLVPTENGRGYDINYKLRKDEGELALAATVTDPASGRVLEAYTTEPGMQLFTLDHAVCLEMQHFPDSPNKPQFPSVVLNPGETYRQVTIYKFSTVQP